MVNLCVVVFFLADQFETNVSNVLLPVHRSRRANVFDGGVSFVVIDRDVCVIFPRCLSYPILALGDSLAQRRAHTIRTSSDLIPSFSNKATIKFHRGFSTLIYERPIHLSAPTCFLILWCYEYFSFNL